MTKTEKKSDPVETINKLRGPSTLRRLSDAGDMSVSRLSSGNISVDDALGGGWAQGRINEVFGSEGSGKSALAAKAVAEAQKRGLEAVYLDAENTLEPEHAISAGVDWPNLIFGQPDTAEETLEIVKDLVVENVGIIVIDSVTALTTEAELNGDIGDAHISLLARLMSQSLRIINNHMIKNKSQTTVLFINQLRTNIGGMPGKPSNTTSGGRALKFYATQRLELTRIGNLDNKGDVYGHTVKVKVAKNKVSPPFRQTTFDVLYYGGGISNENSIIDMAEKKGILRKAGGGWYTNEDGESLAQGKEKLRIKLLEDTTFRDELLIQIQS